ncbi:tetratricopeptide repeat protein [Parafilimonas sp.]|uniref:tetratricopeptide repeat protein n=1 Tax=Parafilimonas sp. TaxID=1969739 RepID=UPI003F7E4241
MNFKLKRLPVFITCMVLSLQIFAQDNAALLREAKQLELKFDEAGALEKYKQLAIADASNINALVKCAELNCSIGNREKDINSKTNYFKQALVYAQQAYAKDSTNSDVCYAMALVNYKMNVLDPDNKQLIENIKQVKIYSDRSLTANPNNAKANYLLGMWHFELIHSGWLKKKGVKDFYDKIPDTQIDSAVYYMEKARRIEPYFAQDYLDLAKVYIYDHQPAKALEVLNKLIKLPNRTYDDTAYKEEGKQLLEKMR